ncbi:MAG: STAS domain-containing protein [Planctomycetota bacterium]
MPIQKWSDTIWVSTPSDDPAFAEEIETLRNSAESNDPIPHVIIDLAGVGHLNSSNLSQMLRLRKLCVDSDKQLRVAGPNNACWSLFLTTGLDKVFAFSSDTTTALAELQIAG